MPDQAPTSTYVKWKRSVNQTWTGASYSRRSLLQLQQLIFIQAMPDQAQTSTYVRWKRSVNQTWTDRPEHAPVSTTYWCWLFYCNYWCWFSAITNQSKLDIRSIQKIIISLIAFLLDFGVSISSGGEWRWFPDPSTWRSRLIWIQIR